MFHYHFMMPLHTISYLTDIKVLQHCGLYPTSFSIIKMREKRTLLSTEYDEIAATVRREIRWDGAEKVVESNPVCYGICLLKIQFHTNKGDNIWMHTIYPKVIFLYNFLKVIFPMLSKYINILLLTSNNSNNQQLWFHFNTMKKIVPTFLNIWHNCELTMALFKIHTVSRQLHNSNLPEKHTYTLGSKWLWHLINKLPALTVSWNVFLGEYYLRAIVLHHGMGSCCLWLWPRYL